MAERGGRGRGGYSDDGYSDEYYDDYEEYEDRPDGRRGGGGRRIGVWLITGALLAVLIGGGYAVYHALQNKLNPKDCTISQAGGDSVTVDNDQAGNAATIAAVGQARGLPVRAVIVALATARQESKLSNLSYGDRDSLGLFQQRPSMGWGTAEQVNDPVYASGKFYSVLTKVTDWQNLGVGVAAQKVQRSADPSGDSYARWESMATLLADALSGQAGTSLTCTPDDAGTLSVETPGADGFTPRAAAVSQALTKAFGATTISTNSGKPKATPSGDGRTLTIPADSDDAQRAFARWAVAQATALQVDRVGYADQLWTRESGKWQKTDQVTPAGQVTVTVLKGGS
jgi:hypothetical protein